MAHIFLVPHWFFGYDIVMELVFGVIALIVSLFAFKIYKLSDQNQSRLFGIAFLFISFSYFIQSFLNFAIISRLNETICLRTKIIDVAFLNNMGILFHIILFSIGLITLAYMTLKIRNNKTYLLLFFPIILSLLFSSNRLYLFYLLSSVMLIFVFIHYLNNYLKRKDQRTLLILTAFAFLLFGSIHFIFSVNHSLFYAIGHILGLIAYLLILLNLILIIKK